MIGSLISTVNSGLDACIDFVANAVGGLLAMLITGASEVISAVVACAISVLHARLGDDYSDIASLCAGILRPAAVFMVLLLSHARSRHPGGCGVNNLHHVSGR